MRDPRYLARLGFPFLLSRLLPGGLGPVHRVHGTRLHLPATSFDYPETRGLTWSRGHWSCLQASGGGRGAARGVSHSHGPAPLRHAFLSWPGCRVLGAGSLPSDVQASWFTVIAGHSCLTGAPWQLPRRPLQLGSHPLWAPALPVS